MSFSDYYKIFLNILGTITGLAVTAFSLYFASKKIGQSISVGFSVGTNLFTAERIKDLILVNNKDRTINIFSIEAVINKEMILTLNKFDVPLILGSYENKKITISEISSYHVGNEKYVPDFLFNRSIEIFLFTDHGVIKCKEMKNPNTFTHKRFKKFKHISTSKKSFNGLVYNENAVYAVTCLINGEVRTGLVSKGGFISPSPFHFNSLKKEDLDSEESVKKAIEAAGYEKIFVDKVK